jgi:hypothetical protein
MPKLLLLVVYLIVGAGFLVTDDGAQPTVMSSKPFGTCQ